MCVYILSIYIYNTVKLWKFLKNKYSTSKKHDIIQYTDLSSFKWKFDLGSTLDKKKMFIESIFEHNNFYYFQSVGIIKYNK